MVYLPYALGRKYSHTNKEWGWVYVFPATRISTDPRTGIRRRHHIYETVLQKALNASNRDILDNFQALWHLLKGFFIEKKDF